MPAAEDAVACLEIAVSKVGTCVGAPGSVPSIKA